MTAKAKAQVASARLKLALSRLLWAELARLDITAAELARRSGLSDQTCRDILAGATEPRLGQVLALERGLGSPGLVSTRLANPA